MYFSSFSLIFSMVVSSALSCLGQLKQMLNILSQTARHGRSPLLLSLLPRSNHASQITCHGKEELPVKNAPPGSFKQVFALSSHPS